MIEHGLDKKLLDRTVELAKRTGKFGWQHLKVALDSSPLLGAGRVLDTWNLIGRALSTVVTCAAKVTGRTREEVLAEADLTVLSQSSLKVALDIDWDDDAQRAAALDRLLQEVGRLEKWVATHAAAQAAEPPLREALVRCVVSWRKTSSRTPRRESAASDAASQKTECLRSATPRCGMGARARTIPSMATSDIL